MYVKNLFFLLAWLMWITACTNVLEQEAAPIEITRRPLATAVSVSPEPTNTPVPSPTSQPTMPTQDTPEIEPTNTPTPTSTSPPLSTPTDIPWPTPTITPTPIPLPESCAEPSIVCEEMQFSPDGRYLVYRETRLDEPYGCGHKQYLQVVDALTLEPLFMRLWGRFSTWLTPDQLEIIDIRSDGCEGTLTRHVINLQTGEEKTLFEPGYKRGWTPDQTAYYDFGETWFWVYDIETGIATQSPNFYDSYSYHTLCWDAAGSQLLFTRDPGAQPPDTYEGSYEFLTMGQREVWRFDRETTTFTQLLANPDHGYFLTNLNLNANEITTLRYSQFSVYGHEFECQWSNDWIQVHDVMTPPKVLFLLPPRESIHLLGTIEEQKCGWFGIDCENSTVLALNTKTGETKPWSELNLAP